MDLLRRTLSGWLLFGFTRCTLLLFPIFASAELRTRSGSLVASGLRCNSRENPLGAKNGILSEGLGDWYDMGPKAPGYAQLTGMKVTATAIYYRDLTLWRRSRRCPATLRMYRVVTLLPKLFARATTTNSCTATPISTTPAARLRTPSLWPWG